MRSRLSLLAVLGLPLALAACGGGAGPRVGGYAARSYQPPGPPEDPWGPYISEASTRFAVPEQWIRAVIRQESGGHAYRNGAPITSFAGAMGLMQLMPSTYAELSNRYGLGNDPYEPHDNIMAGTGYISELYKRYGSPAFLVAYNAGPHRLDLYLAGQSSLPNETVNYVASIAPVLGGPPMSGPLAVYAQGGRAPYRMPAHAPAYSYASNTHVVRQGGCVRDLDAAYDPSHPCGIAPGPVQVAEAPTAPNTILWGGAASAATPATAAQPAPAPYTPPPRAYQAAAYPAPAYPAPPYPAAAYPVPARRTSRFDLIASAQAEPVPMTAGGARWGVQVGAFPDPATAQQTAEHARTVAPAILASAHTVVGQTTHPNGAVWYRARLIGITHPAADTACGMLSAKRWPCLTVPPGG